MNLQQLKYFLVLAQCKNYHQAAEQLFISQPALSKAMKNLEEELHVSLFNKVGKETHLTKYGSLFLSHVKTCIGALDQGVTQLNTFARENESHIRISAVYPCASQCVPLSIAEFELRFPQVHFSCHQGDSQIVVNDILNGEADLGFIIDTTDIFSDPCLEKIKVLDYPAMLAVSNKHPLAQRKAVNYQEIAKDPFITYAPESGNYRLLQANLDAYGFPFPSNIKIQYNSDEAILSAVQHNLGIAIVTATKFNLRFDVQFIPIKNVLLQFPVYMVWKANTFVPTVVNAYKDYILQAYHLKTFFDKEDRSRYGLPI